MTKTDKIYYTDKILHLDAHQLIPDIDLQEDIFAALEGLVDIRMAYWSFNVSLKRYIMTEYEDA